MSGKCWRCGGSGYVRNCEIPDGVMTGFDECGVCAGSGRVTLAQLVAEIERMKAVYDGPETR